MTLLSNTSPCSFNKSAKNLKSLNLLKKENKLYANQLIVLLFLLTRNKNNKKSITSFSIFIKPKTHKKFTILRAPYRYKGARIHLVFQRYFILINWYFSLKSPIIINNHISLSNFNNMLQKLPAILDSSMCKQHKSRVNYPVLYSMNFFLKHYV